MNLDPTKLCKVLALLDSDHEGERQAALGRARSMLASAKLKFVDLPTLLGKAPDRPKPKIDLGGFEEGYNAAMVDLRAKQAAAYEAGKAYNAGLLRSTEMQLEVAEKEWRKAVQLERPAGRREAAIKLLSNVDTPLSDRQIAYRTNLSPTTVGKLRRSLSNVDTARGTVDA